ncbi:Na+/H+ antiporter subunit D [Granulicoccus phenolivorans]|uniref:Na+/H+ antiporter subunit D n=1 Tax=Granulicoccus phenolivorans TaxID=266854 RepID=UPI0003FCE1BD|nr:Na+/H+ antiporter subunit D [Granulicoccus phenolivorans]
MNIDPTVLIPLPVVIPLVAAGLTLVTSRLAWIQRAISGTALGLVVAVSAALVWLTDHGDPMAMVVGNWSVTEGIVLIVDRLSALMLLVSTVVTLGVMLFSAGRGISSDDDEHDGEAPLPIFHPTLLVLSAGVSTTFLTGDLFHMYVGFEMLLFASFVLLTLGGTQDRVRAGINYVLVNLLSSMVFLTAIGMVYAATGTVNLARLAQRLPLLSEDTQLALQLMLLLGFSIKAAVFPMSAWLPDSYPTASAPVTAVFAGLLTKVGVYAILRTQTLLFPGDRVQTMLLVAAVLTMLVGILGAVAQDDIKRILSYTLVSHIGYMLFGIALGNQAGVSAAIFYVVHHILVQTTLFLVTGLVELRAGSTSLKSLGGLIGIAPLTSLLYFIPAMNLSGIPPLSGFLGKVGLIQAGVEQGSPLAYVVIGGALLTSLITLYAMARVWARAFWRDPVEEAPQAPQKITAGVIIPTALLVACTMSLTVFAGPLYRMTDAAALALLERTPYITAVLGL